ncbi:MAG TPA: prephenate dehydrogenase/arogenate dehydrogenase family protein [Candidatus Dormibacteraeota bacterium]|jgi:prephenate dehydrogenase|nr:prephenate dehydrogenase/arogenate dehydrogenase family protein [Candidatus Dormibacteraeota bacterium]
MRIGIYGLGLMGGSLALALAARRPDLPLSGHDPDAATMERARDLGIVDGSDPRTADVVFLAAPILSLRGILAGLVGAPGIVTDLASTKVEVLRWAEEAGVDLVGGHPMCGSERSGLEAARADLFEGAPWALMRDEPVVTELVRSVGARPMLLDAERHDRLVAGISHAAFAVSAAYLLAMSGDDDWEAMAALAGPGFRDMTRLAAGDPRFYAAVAATNRSALLDRLVRVEGSLARLRSLVEDGDGELEALFAEAKRVRDAWAREA